MVKYDPDAFFSAERYPLPMKCSECGKTMRPVHKHCTPDMPRTYFCTFCGVGIYEDNPGIRFSRKPTNADRIRAMSDEELAVNFNDNFLCPPGYATADGTLLTDKCAYHAVKVFCNDSDDEPCRRCWLDWLRQEATE